MNNCDRCKDWQEQGLSDTCPSCDLGNELDARRELISAKVTLNGKPAAIAGAYNSFANVLTLDGSQSFSYSWEAVERIVKSGGAFKS